MTYLKITMYFKDKNGKTYEHSGMIEMSKKHFKVNKDDSFKIMRKATEYILKTNGFSLIDYEVIEVTQEEYSKRVS